MWGIWLKVMNGGRSNVCVLTSWYTSWYTMVDERMFARSYLKECNQPLPSVVFSS
jgi:hypothetical protein